MAVSKDDKTFTDTGKSSSTFTLEDKLSSDVKAVQFSFTENKNQVGIASIVLGSGSEQPVDYRPVFANQTYNLTVGKTHTLELGASYPSTITFSVDGTAVSHAGNGVFNADEVGNATVNATWTADKNWNAGSATCNFVVSEAPVVVPGSNVFQLVKNASELNTGDKIIIANSKVKGSQYAMGATNGNGNNRAQVEVTINSEKIEPSDAVAILTLEKNSEGQFYIYDEKEKGYLHAAKGDKNYLKTDADNMTYSLASIDINSSTSAATIKFVSTDLTKNLIRYNSSSSMFSCYNGGQNDVYIYKEIALTPEKETVDVTVAPVELYQLISLGGDQYVTYNPDETVQYDVTMGSDNVVTDFKPRAEGDKVEAYADNAKWTAMVACVATLPAEVPADATVNVAGKIGEDEVKCNPAGDNYVGVKNFADLTGWDGYWSASLTAETADKIYNGTTSDDNLLILSMPVYRIKNVTYALSNSVENVTVADVKAGEGIHELNDALVNSIDVTVNLLNPNVVEGLLPVLDSKINSILVNLGEEFVDLKSFNGSETKSVTFKGVDPYLLLNADWTVKEDLTAGIACGECYEGFNVLKTNDAATPVKLNAELTKSLQIPDVTYTPIRMKIREGSSEAGNDKNHYFTERIYLQKTNLAEALKSAERSMIENNKVQGDAACEYVLVKAGEEVKAADYVNLGEDLLETPAGSGNKHHKLSELEADENLIVLAKTDIKTFWYDNMGNDHWIADTAVPSLSVDVANVFAAEVKAVGNGVVVVEHANAPALQADAVTATHKVFYPAAAVQLKAGDILTAVEEVEVANEWIKVGAGSFEVVANGVMVYDLNGVMIADGQGRYNVPAGIYLAVYGKKAVKVVVK